LSGAASMLSRSLCSPTYRRGPVRIMIVVQLIRFAHVQTEVRHASTD